MEQIKLIEIPRKIAVNYIAFELLVAAIERNIAIHGIFNLAQLKIHKRECLLYDH